MGSHEISSKQFIAIPREGLEVFVHFATMAPFIFRVKGIFYQI